MLIKGQTKQHVLNMCTIESVNSRHFETQKTVLIMTRGVLISQVHLYTFILQWDRN